MENMIKVARLRNSPYIVNYKTDGGIKRYEWVGSKSKKTDVKDIPESIVNHLLMSSKCFSDGELKIINDNPIAEELISNIGDEEKYNDNTHTREDIIKILEGNTNSMKKELNKITVVTEKNFIVDVAKEINLDSSSKRSFLAEWIGIPIDILFAED